MAIPNNTTIILGIHEPKKNALVEAPPVAALGVNEIRIHAGAGINENLTQSIVGGLIKLHRMAQTELARLDGNGTGNATDVLHMVLGGSDNDIEINGTPNISQLRLEIGTYTGAGDRSHFLDRTFKRLIERWLEESK